MSTFITRLRIAMQLRNCSGRKLCEQINVHQSTISNYLNGVCEPKQDKLVAIAKALRVNQEWLAGEDAPMLNSPMFDSIVAIIKNLDDSELKRVLDMLHIMFGDKIGY